MSVLDEIMRMLKEEGSEAKVTIIKVGDPKDDSEEKEKNEEVKLSIKDSTRAAKLAKIKIMISVYDQIKGLSAEETGDVLGAVRELIDHSGEMIALDENLGRFFIKKGEKATREILADMENDEPAGD